nr:PREDICTED: enolase-phosphatase E1-like [Megachile rotundata]
MAALPGWTHRPTTLVGTIMDCLLNTKIQAVADSSKNGQKQEEAEKGEGKDNGRFTAATINQPIVQCTDILQTPRSTSLKDKRGARDRSALRIGDGVKLSVVPKVKDRAAPRRRKQEEDDDSGSESVISVDLTPSASNRADRPVRQKGRPPTTGECVGLAETHERHNEAKRKSLVLDRQLRVFDESLPAPGPCQASKRLTAVEHLSREVRWLPSMDLFAEMLKNADVIRPVAACSQKLKGTNVRILQIASNTIEAYTAELAKRPVSRLAQARADRDEEMECLKRQIREAGEQRRQMVAELPALKKQMEELREGSAIPGTVTSPVATVPRRRTETRRRLSSSSSEREDNKRRQLSAVGAEAPTPTTGPRREPHEQLIAPKPTTVDREIVAADKPTEQNQEAGLETVVAILIRKMEELAAATEAQRKPQEQKIVAEPTKVERRPVVTDKATEKRQEAGLETVVATLIQRVEELAAEVRGGKAGNAQAAAGREGQAKQAKPPSRRSSVARKSATRPGQEAGPANPPPKPAPTGETWATEVGRKAKRAAKKAQAAVKIGPAKGPQTAAKTAKKSAGAGTAKPAAATVNKPRAATGGLILGIPGEQSKAKAEKLAERL